MRTPLADDSIRKCLTRSELLSPVLMKGQKNNIYMQSVEMIYNMIMILIHKSDKVAMAVIQECYI